MGVGLRLSLRLRFFHGLEGRSDGSAEEEDVGSPIPLMMRFGSDLG